MKTFKELQESITKALVKFGSKGLRKVQPNVSYTEFGKTISKFVPDIEDLDFISNIVLVEPIPTLQSEREQNKYLAVSIE